MEEENHSHKNLRLFIAFPLPEQLWEGIHKIKRNNDTSKLRWTPLQNLHITLFFLGAVYESDLNAIIENITAVVSQASPFIIEFEKISLQKGRRKSGMIWMKFMKHEKFSAIGREFKIAIDELLIHPAQLKDSIPHVTLARWNGRIDLEKVNIEFDNNDVSCKIDYCELWQSVTTKEGVRYDSLAQFQIGSRFEV